jgi:hypothetical protein
LEKWNRVGTQTTNHMVVDVSGFSGSGGSYKPLRTGNS